MLLGGVAALRRDDAKQSLAFGTVSQLGLLVVLFGVGDAHVTAAGGGGARGPRPVQVGAVPGDRRGRPRHRQPRPAPPVRCRPRPAGARLGRRAVHAVDGRGAAAARIRRQGVGARGAGRRRRRLVDRRRSWWSWLGSVLTTAYSIRLWWGLFATKPNVADADGRVHHRAARCGRRRRSSCSPALSLAGGVGASPLRRSAVGRRGLARCRPPRSTWRCGPGSTCRCCSRC